MGGEQCDVEVAEALILGGRTSRPEAIIAGGTALGNAIGYGCWRVARLLLQNGAKGREAMARSSAGNDFHGGEVLPGEFAALKEELNDAFWQACSGGYRRTAEYLLRGVRT